MPKARAAIVPVTPFQQNCTLLWEEDTNTGVVIDPRSSISIIPVSSPMPLTVVAPARAGREGGAITVTPVRWPLLACA